MRYTKFKKHIKITCFGKDDILESKTDSQYKINGNFTNCKRCRYLLNGVINDIQIWHQKSIIKIMVE